MPNGFETKTVQVAPGEKWTFQELSIGRRNGLPKLQEAALKWADEEYADDKWEAEGWKAAFDNSDLVLIAACTVAIDLGAETEEGNDTATEVAKSPHPAYAKRLTSDFSLWPALLTRLRKEPVFCEAIYQGLAAVEPGYFPEIVSATSDASQTPKESKLTEEIATLETAAAELDKASLDELPKVAQSLKPQNGRLLAGTKAKLEMQETQAKKKVS